MDFQTHQDEANQSTALLIALFVAGIAAIVALVTALLTALLFFGSNRINPVAALGLAAPATTFVIVGTSLFKSSQIKGGGGSYVAESLGGRPVDFNTLDPGERQLSNVVEEIAIASGMPVPAVFVLDQEPGINAFAAGWSADNAAIGVTRGALQHLNRAELQGVIAHEFAHIRNGDTRVKTRIIGWVFGIAAITFLARIILRQAMWSGRGRRRGRQQDNSVIVILAAGAALLVIGYLGSVFAKMIQAAVSRQRELLADASAVQYTRDPDGIGMALMKIGGMAGENSIRSAHATEASHLFFTSAFGAKFATHPPLSERIKKLVPNWNGQFTEPMSSSRTPVGVGAGAGQPTEQSPWGASILPGQTLPGMPNLGLPIDPAILAAGAVGDHETSRSGHSNSANQNFGPPSLDGPSNEHIAYAKVLLSRIPPKVQNFLHTRQGAVAAVTGLLVSTETATRSSQLAQAGQSLGLDPQYLGAAGELIAELDRPLQLPAIDIALHSIRELPDDFKDRLAQTIQALETTRQDQDLFRWMLRRVLLRHLADQYDDGSAIKQVPLGELRDHAVVVYAMIAWFNSAGPGQATDAFEAALEAAGLPVVQLPGIDSLPVDSIDNALEQLSFLDSSGRHQFVLGATAAVLDDGKSTADEAELIRVVADAVRLPVPPLLPV